MANKHAAKEKPLFNTRLGVTLIVIFAVIIAVLIFFFLVLPIYDPQTVVVHVVAPHVHKIIVKTPRVKALTAVQLHAHHLWHVTYLTHMHMLHVKHVAHVKYIQSQS